MTADAFANLRLARTRGIGPVGFRQLVQRFGNAATALDALPGLARKGGGRSINIAPADRINAEIDRVASLGGQHIFAGSSKYPALLEQSPGAPTALIAKGRMGLLDQPSVAIVGARNASAAACRFARMLAQQLGDAGHVVVSGLARGIDSAAHLGAIECGTIAVIANGLDLVFPQENAALQDRIGHEHLLLTEYPPGVEPLARQFPQRNRIIAGLSLGTVVVEAAPKSGSLLTARLAAEAGREVMAVPGSPLDPRAQGCNQLIREGATLIQTVDDVLEALAPMGMGAVRQGRAAFVEQSEPGLTLADDATDAERDLLVGLLSPVAVSIDEIARQSGLATPVIQMVVLELELAGRAHRHGNGYVSRTS